MDHSAQQRMAHVHVQLQQRQLGVAVEAVQHPDPVAQRPLGAAEQHRGPEVGTVPQPAVQRPQTGSPDAQEQSVHRHRRARLAGQAAGTAPVT